MLSNTSLRPGSVNALLTGLPHILISVSYLCYNQAFTCMAVVAEYTSYFGKRQPLRVTTPRGFQVSSVFLSLRGMWILSIMIITICTNFLLSQGFFVAQIRVIEFNGVVNESDSIYTVGFSVWPLVASIIVATVSVISSFLLGFRWYGKVMPFAKSCSAVISAACHAEKEEVVDDIGSREVQWGLVGSTNGVGHLSFSSRLVSEPVPGRLYM
jgi:hypothetical protein